MKKLLFVLIALVCLTACGKPEDSSSVSPEPEPSPEPTFDLTEYENPVKLAKQWTRIGNYTCNVYVDHVEILEYHGRDAIVEIPETLNDIPVTVLGGGYFGLADEIRFPEGLLAIKGGTFNRSITEFALPKGLKYLDLHVFYCCNSLQHLTLPASLETLVFPYFYTSNLTNIQVAEGNLHFAAEDGVVFDKAMETLLFCPQGRTGSYTVPDTVTAIAMNAFSGCALSEIILPEGLTEISPSAFSECTKLKTVLLPKSLTTIDSSAFSASPALTSIEVAEGNPNFVSVDGVLYTRDMTELLVYPMAKPDREYALPETVTAGWYLPLTCTNLETLHIPAGVQGYNFAHFEGEKEIYFSGTAKDWLCLFQRTAWPSVTPTVHFSEDAAEDTLREGDYAYTLSQGEAVIRRYLGKDSRIAVPETLGGCPVTEIAPRAFSFLGTAEEITLPEGIRTIGEQAFYGSSLSTVSIPATAAEIGPEAFTFCDKLESITVSAANPCYASADGVLYTADMTELLRIPPLLKDPAAPVGELNFRTSYILPTTVTTIAEDAFLGCSHLDAIGVAGGNPAFSGVDGVLITADGTTLVAYPADAMARHVPDSVTKTASWAFAYSWMPDRSAHLLSHITQLGAGAFAWSGLPSVTFPAQFTAIPADACLGSTIDSVTIPAGVTEIGQDAFLHCYNLTTVYYGGTKEDWAEINIASGNEALKTAAIHYSKHE